VQATNVLQRNSFTAEFKVRIRSFVRSWSRQESVAANQESGNGENELALMQVVTLNMSVSFSMRIPSPPPPPRFKWVPGQKLQIRVR
jgi:hypothetical protein